MYNAAAEPFRVPLRWWRARGVLAQDAGLAAAFTVLGLLPLLAANGLRPGDLPVHRAGALAVLLALAQSLPLVIRRRWPAVALALIACAFAADQLLGYPRSFSSVGLLLALYAAGAYEASFRRELIVGATASYVVLACGLAGLGASARPVDYAVFYLALSACWGAGAFVRSRPRSGRDRRQLAGESRHAAGPQASSTPVAQPARSAAEPVWNRPRDLLAGSGSSPGFGTHAGGPKTSALRCSCLGLLLIRYEQDRPVVHRWPVYRLIRG